VTRLSSTPDIRELLEDPSRVADLPAEVARALFVRVAALQAALTVTVVPASTPDDSPTYHGDRLLDAEQVGRLLGKSRSWVDHHVEDLPPRRRVGGEGRWSEKEIQRWIQNAPRWNEEH
jgi:predicted DNA-binding transcriptional regulator AlpA